MGLDFTVPVRARERNTVSWCSEGVGLLRLITFPLGLAVQRCSSTMELLWVKKLHEKGSAPSKGWQAYEMWVAKGRAF